MPRHPADPRDGRFNLPRWVRTLIWLMLMGGGWVAVLYAFALLWLFGRWCAEWLGWA